jgi:16S rRNA (cytosine1402-N4)-methyltransferase
VTAAEIVNKFSQEELESILKKYGQERFARSIASNIVRRRAQKSIETTQDLANIIKFSVPAKFRRNKNPCKKSFQAIRIAVNGELESLETGLEASFDLLKAGGRLVVITFHSLEDRLVKQKYKTWSKGCVCPPKAPICVCGNVPQAKIVNKKAIRPSDLEIATNPRSKSAKLRILEKL